MKKIYFLMISCFVSAFSMVYAQFSCANAVPITSGYSATGITTPGAGSGSTGAWVTSAPTCGGGSSSTQPTSTQCYYQVFTTAGDDYLFSYTTGAVAGESVFFEIKTKQPYMGLAAFTGCTGTAFTGCLKGAYSPSTNGTLSVTLTDLAANQTIYFAVGIWSTPNNLNFDVTNFTVTPSPLSVNDTDKKKNEIKIYPNPVEDVLSFSNLAKNTDVTIYNLQGQRLIEKNIKPEEQINVSELASGIYMVKLISGDTIKTYKIIKK